MKMQKKTLVSLIASTLLFGSAAAMAFGGGHGSERGGCDHGGPMRALEQLDNVTDEQRTQLRKLFDEQRETMREKRDAMRENRRAVHEAIRNGAGTEEIRSLATKQGEQVTAMIMAKAELRQKMATILSEEQMKALQDYRMEKMERHKHW